MANSVPVLTIDIDDSKIKRLEDVAKQFHDAFNTMPSGSIPSGRPRGGYIPGKENGIINGFLLMKKTFNIVHYLKNLGQMSLINFLII